MLTRIKQATKDTIIYSLGNISTKIIGLVLLPLYTDKLSVAEYGVLGTVEITIQLLIAVFSFSLHSALNRWYWDKNFRDKQKSIFYTVLISTVLGSLLMILLLAPFTGMFSEVLLDSRDYGYLFLLLLISAAFQILARLVLSLIRLQRKSLLFTTTNILKLLVTLGLTIYFIVDLKRGIEGILEAQIIGFVFFILLNLKMILKNLYPVFERSILKEMVWFSYPLAISAMSGVLLTVTDRYAVRYIGGLEDMGLYSLGFKVANVLKIFVINSVASALLPLKFQMMDKPGNKRFYSKIMTYTALGFTVLLLFLSLFSQEAIKLLAQNPDYWSAYQIVPILCYSQFFLLLRHNARFGLIVEKKTKIISLIMIVVSILNIGLNILLVSFYGIIGASVAALLAQVIFFVFIYGYAQKHYPIPYEVRKLFVLLLLSVAVILVAFLYVNPMELIPRIIIKFGLIVSFPFMLYLLKFYEPVELQRLRGAWHKWKNPANWKENLKQIKIQ